MNIIQSFWSLPSKVNPTSAFGRNNGGWLNERQHAMSWSLSCLKLKQFYPDIKLFTDTEGMDWLINKLALPYNDVDCCLDNISHFNPTLWALAKLYTYSLQEEPFLHIDSDVYIWKPFDQNFLNNDLIAQNLEFDLNGNADGSIYIDTALKLQSMLESLPEAIEIAINELYTTGRIQGYNTGIVGGRNTDFFKEYTRLVFGFLEKETHIHYESRDMSFFEQLFLYGLAFSKKLDVSVLYGEQLAVSPSAYAIMMQFNLIPITENYIHVVGIGKRNEMPSSQVELRLRYEFPVAYQHIGSVYGEKLQYYYYKQDERPITFELEKNFPCCLHLLNKINPSDKKDSLSSFSKTVENLITDDLNTTDLQLLSDFFQLEKFESTIKNLPLQQGTSDNQLLNFLYTLSPDEFLELKFKLNSQTVNLTTMYFKYPAEIPAGCLLDVYKNYANGRPSFDMRWVLLTKNKDCIKIEELHSWAMLLTFYENKPASGVDLLKYIKTENFYKGSSSEDLSQQVLAFITVYSICFNYLILTN